MEINKIMVILLLQRYQFRAEIRIKRLRFGFEIMGTVFLKVFVINCLIHFLLLNQRVKVLD